MFYYMSIYGNDVTLNLKNNIVPFGEGTGEKMLFTMPCLYIFKCLWIQSVCLQDCTTNFCNICKLLIVYILLNYLTSMNQFSRS